MPPYNVMTYQCHREPNLAQVTGLDKSEQDVVVTIRILNSRNLGLRIRVSPEMS